MCWLCGRIRPNDGPEEAKAPNPPSAWRYRYHVGARILDANEGAEWEDLDAWPAWDDVDEDGVRYFVDETH
jgi:hypothetical protein